MRLRLWQTLSVAFVGSRLENQDVITSSSIVVDSYGLIFQENIIQVSLEEPNTTLKILWAIKLGRTILY